MQFLILLLTLLSFFSFSYAQEIRIKDMPDKHWAEKSVYKLIKLGITSGYPDGTFAGLNNMNRQEIAVFLSNFYQKTDDYYDIERLLAELKAEFATAKYETENPQNPFLSGEYSQNFIVGNPTVSGPKGPKANYRLKLSLYKALGISSTIKVNLDSMDTGFSNLQNNSNTGLLDFEGKIRRGDTTWRIILGPNYSIHRETDLINPSDDYTVILRPKTSLGFETTFQNLGISCYGIAHQQNYFGYTNTLEATCKFSYTYKNIPLFGKTTVSAQPRFLWNDTTNDSLAEINILSSPYKFMATELSLGIGNIQSISGLYVKAVVKLETDTTVAKLIFYKVGSDYRKPFDKHEFIGLNLFNKFIINGTVDIGAALSYKLNDKFWVNLKNDAVLLSGFKYGKEYNGTSFTSEIGLEFSPSYFSKIRGFYRTYSVPSKISSFDPSISAVVPEFSNALGLSATFKM